MHRTLILLATTCLATQVYAQPPAPVGGDMSNTTVKPTGGTVARKLADITADKISVLAFTGVKADGQIFDSKCSITNGTATVTCTGTAFASTDVGKSALLRGMGTAGGITPTTISAVTDATHVTLAVSATADVTNGSMIVGTDSTAGIAAAIAWAQTNKEVLWFPAGLYWLASSSTAIALRDVSLMGPGNGNAAGQHYTGAVLMVSNQASSQFTLSANVVWDGLTVFYPAQAGLTPTPIVYPYLFECATTPQACVTTTFSNFNFINPYILLGVTSTTSPSAIGRVSFTSGWGYCVFSCFYMLAGGADVLNIGRETYWAQGAYPDSSTGNAYLPKWTSLNGEWLHVDVGAATYNSVDGVIINPYIIHGYRYVVRVISGLLSASITPNYADGTPTVLSVEGVSGYNGTVTIPGWIYGHHQYDSTLLPNTFQFSCAGGVGVDINIVGNYSKYSGGNFIDNTTGSCINSLNVVGNLIHNFGASDTVGSYYGIKLVGSGTRAVNISSNVFDVVNHPGSTHRPVYMAHCNGVANIAGNTFRNGLNMVTDACTETSNAQLIVSGNVSSGTSAATSMLVSNVHSPLVINNLWDKSFPSTISAAMGGGGRAIACLQDWHDCLITVGAAPTGTGTVDFPWTQSAAPVCTVQDTTTAVQLLVATTTTQAVITGAMVASDKIVLRCTGY